MCAKLFVCQLLAHLRHADARSMSDYRCRAEVVGTQPNRRDWPKADMAPRPASKSSPSRNLHRDGKFGVPAQDAAAIA